MPIKEYPHNWNIDALLDNVWCPCCGHDIWIEKRGNGFWCETCNLHISRIREPNGDQGYILEFDDAALWEDEAVRSFPDNATDATAKWLGVNDPQLYWFTVWNKDTTPAEKLEWNPVDRATTPS